MEIRAQAVCKDYRLGRAVVHALRGASLRIEQGEFVAIKGPSGSGKSTLLHILGGLDRPTSGDVWIGDKHLNEVPDSELAAIRRDAIGFIFQSFNLIPVLSVFGNVELPLMLQKVPKEERHDRVRRMLHGVGLQDRAEHKTEELSGGQRQRVAIARALVTRPRVVLSDEPTANLDSKTGTEILDLMRQLNRDHKVTLVFATHDHGIVERADRIINILDGQIADDQRVSIGGSRKVTSL
ncbi:MAG TPA: ABC transporter ATP-binding protein [Burkholderiaceae bacterium]|nr:ABC transporter ATP-binding protein [Burkholderiaceae bacterium]